MQYRSEKPELIAVMVILICVAFVLLLMLFGCTTHPVAMCPTSATPSPNAMVVCTQLPNCRKQCTVVISEAQATGAGDLTTTTHSQPSVTENKSGPIP